MYDEGGQRYLDCINNVAHGEYKQLIIVFTVIISRFASDITFLSPAIPFVDLNCIWETSEVLKIYMSTTHFLRKSVSMFDKVDIICLKGITHSMAQSK